MNDFASYKKQRNLVVRLNKEAKHTFFDSLDTSKDSKSFWDNCKPYFSNKSGKNGSHQIVPAAYASNIYKE